MNAVEIEQAISELAEQPFDRVEFPFQFLAAFGHKETALRRLRAGNNNTSDVPGGVLLRNNIHLAVAEPGCVAASLAALRTSAANAKGKPKFLLSTDGETLEAEDLASGETIACPYAGFPNHFGFLLPLAGISTIKEIKDNPIDVRATSRLNKLYVELLKENPDWATDARRVDMNHFMARLIFCFFAEDTGIFHGESLFTRTIEQMTERDGGNVHQVMAEIFRAMDMKLADRAAIASLPSRERGWGEGEARLPAYANQFPYVNGALFSGSTEAPRFTRMARTYLLHAGMLDWKAINPDIFGSMIQAVADDEERGALGMHYTSVPNILKVLNPLFLDDLHAKLDAAGQDKRKLLELRRRIARIRVFDPACGSGNFLVIAYKRMRAIEAQINERRGERDRKSDIPLTNFRGIELRNFPAEIARLALIIAEFQCDELYRGQREALAEFLPLAKENWIICGNALRLDWLSVCPPSGKGVKLAAGELFPDASFPRKRESSDLDRQAEALDSRFRGDDDGRQSPLPAEIDFENEGGETYICGNPPYLGNTWQSAEQKAEIRDVVKGRTNSAGFLDYVAGWFIKAADYIQQASGVAAFVSTNSICQGQIVPILWPIIYEAGSDLLFAYTSFKWANLASHNAGVTVAVVGIGAASSATRRLYDHQDDGAVVLREGAAITPYLTIGERVIVEKRSQPFSELAVMEFGNKPSDGGHLLLTCAEFESLGLTDAQRERFIRRIYGSQEFINSSSRLCLWIEDENLPEAKEIPVISERIEAVRALRLASPDKGARTILAKRPHQLKLMRIGREHAIIVGAISSENRDYLPVGVIDNTATVTNKAFALYDAPLWNLALIASRLHWVWIGAVCVRLEMRFSYSNTLGWNTFPVPLLTDQNKADLTECAEAIMLAREAHFPKTIADLYDSEKMPDNLRHAHDRNDEVLERIYIGRRFRNDTERLEKLFDLYTKMAAQAAKIGKEKAKANKRTR